jgi:hypothetical protein
MDTDPVKNPLGYPNLPHRTRRSACGFLCPNEPRLQRAASVIAEAAGLGTSAACSALFLCVTKKIFEKHLKQICFHV